jgi:hypothetical protein
MDIFDTINAHLASNPEMLSQLEMMLRIKFWLLLALAVYFLSLPYREQRKRTQLRKQAVKHSGKNGTFIA